MNSPLNFSLEEFQKRITKTRKKMISTGLNTLIISDPSNMNWLTGYDGWSFYVHQAVILSLDGDPVWWGRGMDANGAKRTVFMESKNIHGYEDTYVQNPEKHPMLDLAKLIKDLQLNEGNIGVEMDNYWFSASAFFTLKKELDVKFVDVTGLVNWQRAIKSKTEIVYMKQAAKIVEHMHEVVVEKAVVGMPKNELIADVYHASVSGVDGIWGDYPSMVPMAPSGMDATAPHLTWNDQPMKKGESTFFEIAGAFKRYQCPQSRTLFLGTPPQKYLDAEKAVLEGINVGLEQAKPGNQCQDIANAFNQTLNKLGFEKDSRCGYAIGVSYPPDWGERTMSFRDGDTSIMQPGMTFHFMPALWLDDGGLEITEPFVITENGAECLCNTPRKMFVKN
ncbi:MAG: ectoine hydrolase DoeA [Paracoccaceae bacterium]|nr:ectoine hydrolase DoeA [Paracoccaceae bacterium]MBL6856126.1 ectoine hydrolase DoeA [Paracoccaceae bacterium]MDC0039699.1 ectoine hydrolase DoeA [Paracoccaceae bacterium]MDG1880494.1 ectoine hydrolase DoeA [Paracoccaceae bacterium]|tara:strand:- start:31 stop:1206 length:1176 start_codon:yes stop_codon:yes gene_type:complete